MLELPTRCPKSITHGHDGGTINGDVDVAFVVDFVVVEVSVYLAHDVLAIVVLSFGDIIRSSKTVGIFFFYTCLCCFWFYRSKEDHLCYYFYGLR